MRDDERDDAGGEETSRETPKLTDQEGREIETPLRPDFEENIEDPPPAPGRTEDSGLKTDSESG